MAKNSITDYSKTASLNTDIQSVDIDEGCLPSGINNAIREIMADLAAVNDGTVSLTSPSFSSVNIDAGTIDGTVIGGTTPAAGTFTTGQFNTSLNVDGTVTADGLTVDANSTTGAVKIQSGDNNTFGGGRAQIAFGYNATDDYQHFVRTAHDIVAGGNKVELLLSDGTQNNTISSGSTRVATFAGSGDISFYEDTGTTAKLFWDASAESLTVASSLNAGAAGNTSSFVASGSFGGGFALDDGAYSGMYTDTAGTNLHFYVGQDIATQAAASARKMTITSSGNVGIGTTLPSAPLDSVSNTNGVSLRVRARSSDEFGLIEFVENNGSTAHGYIGTPLADTLAFYTNGLSERLRIDSSGNAMLAKTSTNTLGTVGHDFGVTGYAMHTRASSNVLYLNRTTSDGNIAEFYKDGTTVGSISTNAGVLTIGNNNSGGIIFGYSGSHTFIEPSNTSGASVDDGATLGSSSKRFRDLYLSGGAYLGGTGAANKLDDYEEGTLTMSSFLTVNGLSAVSHNYALYTKVGNLVHIQGSVNITPSATGTISWVMTTPFDMNQNSGVGQLGTMNAYPYSTNTATGYAIDNSGLNSHQIYCELNITSLSANNVSYSLTYRTA